MAKANKDLTKDINFLFEMGNIRLIKRTWVRFQTPGFANLAEHHFRVFWLAMVIASHEGGDTNKIAKLAMIHDIAESRAGDVDYLSRQYVVRNEELGIHDMLGGTAIEKEFLDLWQEYEDRQTLESKIVKDADNLDVDFELAEQGSQGFTIGQSLNPIRDHVAKEKLYTKTAKAIYDQLKNVDPHAWHTQGRNRINSGDWKK